MARPVSEKTFANMLRVALKEAHAEGGDKLRMLADQLVQKGIDGDMAALKEIADRLDGKPSQQVEIDHAGSMNYVVSGEPVSEADWLKEHGSDE